jgi:hypothetical protein
LLARRRTGTPFAGAMAFVAGAVLPSASTGGRGGAGQGGFDGCLADCSPQAEVAITLAASRQEEEMQKGPRRMRLGSNVL